MSEEIAHATGDLAHWRQRAEACAERNHDLANEVMQERAKRMQAEADVQALRTATNACIQANALGEKLDAWGALKVLATIDHPGAALLAVAQAAAAFVEAKPEYDDLASLLVALKEAVARWER